MSDLEGSEDFFRHLRVGVEWSGEWSTVDWLPMIWLRFSPFFILSLKTLTAPLPRPQRKLLRLQPYDPTIRNLPGKDISCWCPSACNRMLQKIKEQSNLEAKLGAFKETISEGWLTNIQHHPTFSKPNWLFRDQIASEDGIFTKAHRIIIPTTLQKYIFAKLHRPHKVTRRIKLRARTSAGDGWYHDIGDATKACSSCEELQYSQQKELPIPTGILPGHGIPLKLIFSPSI